MTKTVDKVNIFQSRYTCRAYQKKLVSKELLYQVLEDATKSSSWANSQPWEIFVASGKDLECLQAAYLNSFENGEPMDSEIPRPNNWPEKLEKRMQNFAKEKADKMGIDKDDSQARQEHIRNNLNFFGAPVVMFLCMDKSLTEWSILDIGQVSQSIMLAAKYHGLDTAPAYTTIVYPKHVREILNIPNNLKLVLGITLGYGDSEHPQNTYKTNREPLNNIVHFKGN